MNLLIISLAPVALLLVYVYSKDFCEKEPISLLARAFGRGILTAICVLVVTLGAEILGFQPSTWENPYLALFGQSFLEAAVPEELFKFLFLYTLIWKNPKFDEHFDGIVYATVVSLGFACLENVLYVTQYGAATGYFRAFTAVPGHFFFAVIMGYYLSKAKFIPEKKKHYLRLSAFLPILAHGSYDYLVFSFENEEFSEVAGLILLLFFGFNFVLWKQGFKKIKMLRMEDGAQK